MKKRGFDNYSLERRDVSNSSDGILAALYKNIFMVLGVTPERFNVLMDQFLRDPRNGIPTNLKERSSARGNIRKELLRPYMTWKVFCKGLKFLNIPSFSVSITLNHRNGSKTYHTQKIILDELFIEPEDKHGE